MIFMSTMENICRKIQYGITVVNLSNLEIDETYYIGNSGESLDILQTIVLTTKFMP